MHVAADISIRRVSKPDAIPRGRLVIDDEPTDIVLEGIVLEAAVDVADRLVVFLTEDVPFEDALHIHLLDRDLRPLDYAQIGRPYGTGSFERLRLAPPDTLMFSFMAGSPWTMRIHETAKARWFEPPGVRRHWAIRRYFSLALGAG